MARSFWDGFDPDDDFVVTRPVKISGVIISAGTPFDKSLVNTQTLRAMFGAGELRRVKAAPVRAKVVAVAPQEPAPAAPPSDAPPPPPVQRALSVRHVGRGRFAVMEGETRLTAEPLTRDAAETELARLAG